MVKGCRRLSDGPPRARRGRALAVVCLLALALGRARPAGAGADAPAGGGSSGRLVGSVVLGKELSTRRIRFSLYPDLVQPASAATRPADANEMANVVIYFEKSEALDRVAQARHAPPVMRQEGLTFVPHVVAILRGTTVDFPNGDAIFHNVFSLSKASSFDLGRYPKGSSRSIRFDQSGIVKVFCHIHSDMSGVILVLDNPFFAVPDATGHYSIDGLPPGEYRVMAWHERARPLERTVQIRSGQPSVADFSIPLSETAGGE